MQGGSDGGEDEIVDGRSLHVRGVSDGLHVAAEDGKRPLRTCRAVERGAGSPGLARRSQLGGSGGCGAQCGRQPGQCVESAPCSVNGQVQRRAWNLWLLLVVPPAFFRGCQGFQDGEASNSIGEDMMEDEDKR